MRRSHYLKGNDKVELPQHMVFVDTETKGVQVSANTEHHRLWFGVAVYVRIRHVRGKVHQSTEWLEFRSAETFWAWVETKSLARTRLWVFAHNWNFDAAILEAATIPAQRGWELQTYINDKPPFILSFRSAGRTIQLIDTLNYFAGSLESIGESIGVPKLPFPSYDAPMATWRAYCRRDVTVLVKAVLSFRQLVGDYELGNFQPTLASQAMTAYRHRFMPHRILIHGYVDECRLEREGYFGGRTEAFYLGEVDETVYYLDINSMYPYLMREHPYPTILQGHKRNPTWSYIYEILELYSVVAHVTVETDEPVYPIRYNHRLVFPLGEFETTLTTPEFRYALENGHLKKVHYVAIYENAIIFRDYVDTLYKLRQGFKQSGNDTFQYMTKIMLNALYGKWGQSGKKWRDVGDVTVYFPGIKYEENPDTGEVRKLRCRLGILQEQSREGETENSFPAISAHVTAYGRVMLWRLIKQAGKANVYYTDTDSLMVNQQGYDNLQEHIDPSRLGALKLEETSSSVTLWGAKDYQFGDTQHTKGIKKAAVKIGDATWEQDKFISWDYLVSHQQDGYIPIERVQKTMHRIYRKGVVEKSGWVRPFEFQAEE